MGDPFGKKLYLPLLLAGGVSWKASAAPGAAWPAAHKAYICFRARHSRLPMDVGGCCAMLGAKSSARRHLGMWLSPPAGRRRLHVNRQFGIKSSGSIQC